MTLQEAANVARQLFGKWGFAELTWMDFYRIGVIRRRKPSVKHPEGTAYFFPYGAGRTWEQAIMSIKHNNHSPEIAKRKLCALGLHGLIAVAAREENKND